MRRDTTYRAWRTSGVPLIKVVTPGRAAAPREQWGESLPARSRVRAVPHVAFESLIAPEGIISCAACDWCGGRYERLLDVRDVIGGLTMDLHRDMLPLLLTETAERAAWTAMHAMCTKDRPIKYDIPPHVAEFFAKMIDEARQQLHVGGHVRSAVACLTGDGRAFGFRCDDIPPSADDDTAASRRVTIAERLWALRETARSLKTHPEAALAVVEGWATELSIDAPRDVLAYHPSIHPDRKEVFYVAVLTPEFGKSGMSIIHRDGGVADEGPGRFDDKIDLQPQALGAQLLDGLLARSIS